MKTLLFTIIFTMTQTVLAFGQQTTGTCSPIFDDTKIGGSVTINCQGVPAAAMAELNKMLDSTATIDNLNDLLSIRKQELKRTKLTLEDKVKLAEEWRQKYLDLEARLSVEDGDELGKKAAKALQAGNLELAGVLIAKQELVVDKLAANHFNRAEVFQLQYKPVQALPHLKKAYNYRSENREYTFGYALLLQQQNQFKQAILIYEDILQIDRKLGNKPDVAMTLNNLVVLYSDTNRYELAEKHYLEALNFYRKLAQSNPKAYEPDVATTLNNLAILHSDTNRHELVEKHHLEALRIYRKLAQASPMVY